MHIADGSVGVEHGAASEIVGRKLLGLRWVLAGLAGFVFFTLLMSTLLVSVWQDARLRAHASRASFERAPLHE